MIKIEIYTLPVAENGPERQQIADSLAAIGFFRPENLTTAPRESDGPQTGEKTLGEVAADAHVEDKPKTRGRPKKDAPKAEPPADPAPAEAAQDAADEAAEAKVEAKAEAAADKPADTPKVYDINDMRSAGKAYADAYGMQACLADIPAILGYAAFSQVPEDKYTEATIAVLGAVQNNPNNRPRV